MTIPTSPPRAPKALSYTEFHQAYHEMKMALNKGDIVKARQYALIASEAAVTAKLDVMKANMTDPDYIMQHYGASEAFAEQLAEENLKSGIYDKNRLLYEDPEYIKSQAVMYADGILDRGKTDLEKPFAVGFSAFTDTLADIFSSGIPINQSEVFPPNPAEVAAGAIPFALFGQAGLEAGAKWLPKARGKVPRYIQKSLSEMTDLSYGITGISAAGQSYFSDPWFSQKIAEAEQNHSTTDVAFWKSAQILWNFLGMSIIESASEAGIRSVYRAFFKNPDASKFHLTHLYENQIAHDYLVELTRMDPTKAETRGRIFELITYLDNHSADFSYEGKVAWARQRASLMPYLPEMLDKRFDEFYDRYKHFYEAGIPEYQDPELQMNSVGLVKQFREQYESLVYGPNNANYETAVKQYAESLNEKIDKIWLDMQKGGHKFWGTDGKLSDDYRALLVHQYEKQNIPGEVFDILYDIKDIKKFDPAIIKGQLTEIAEEHQEELFRHYINLTLPSYIGRTAGFDPKRSKIVAELMENKYAEYWAQAKAYMATLGDPDSKIVGYASEEVKILIDRWDPALDFNEKNFREHVALLVEEKVLGDLVPNAPTYGTPIGLSRTKTEVQLGTPFYQIHGAGTFEISKPTPTGKRPTVSPLIPHQRLAHGSDILRQTIGLYTITRPKPIIKHLKRTPRSHTIGSTATVYSTNQMLNTLLGIGYKNARLVDLAEDTNILRLSALLGLDPKTFDIDLELPELQNILLNKLSTAPLHERQVIDEALYTLSTQLREFVPPVFKQSIESTNINRLREIGQDPSIAPEIKTAAYNLINLENKRLGPVNQRNIASWDITPEERTLIETVAAWDIVDAEAPIEDIKRPLIAYLDSTVNDPTKLPGPDANTDVRLGQILELRRYLDDPDKLGKIGIRDDDFVSLQDFKEALPTELRLLVDEWEGSLSIDPADTSVEQITALLTYREQFVSDPELKKRIHKVLMHLPSDSTIGYKKPDLTDDELEIIKESRAKIHKYFETQRAIKRPEVPPLTFPMTPILASQWQVTLERNAKIFNEVMTAQMKIDVNSIDAEEALVISKLALHSVPTDQVETRTQIQQMVNLLTKHIELKKLEHARLVKEAQQKYPTLKEYKAQAALTEYNRDKAVENIKKELQRQLSPETYETAVKYIDSRFEQAIDESTGEHISTIYNKTSRQLAENRFAQAENTVYIYPFVEKYFSKLKPEEQRILAEDLLKVPIERSETTKTALQNIYGLLPEDQQTEFFKQLELIDSIGPEARANIPSPPGKRPEKSIQFTGGEELIEAYRKVQAANLGFDPELAEKLMPIGIEGMTPDPEAVRIDTLAKLYKDRVLLAAAKKLGIEETDIKKLQQNKALRSFVYASKLIDQDKVDFRGTHHAMEAGNLESALHDKLAGTGYGHRTIYSYDSYVLKMEQAIANAKREMYPIADNPADEIKIAQEMFMDIGEELGIEVDDVIRDITYNIETEQLDVPTELYRRLGFDPSEFTLETIRDTKPAGLDVDLRKKDSITADTAQRIQTIMESYGLTPEQTPTAIATYMYQPVNAKSLRFKRVLDRTFGPFPIVSQQNLSIRDEIDIKRAAGLKSNELINSELTREEGLSLAKLSQEVTQNLLDIAKTANVDTLYKAWSPSQLTDQGSELFVVFDHGAPMVDIIALRRSALLLKAANETLQSGHISTRTLIAIRDYKINPYSVNGIIDSHMNLIERDFLTLSPQERKGVIEMETKVLQLAHRLAQGVGQQRGHQQFVQYMLQYVDNILLPHVDDLRLERPESWSVPMTPGTFKYPEPHRPIPLDDFEKEMAAPLKSNYKRFQSNAPQLPEPEARQKTIKSKSEPSKPSKGGFKPSKTYKLKEVPEAQLEEPKRKSPYKRTTIK